MFWTHVKLALRSLRRRTGYVLINALGLAAGIACCLLVMLYLQVELSYDAVHEGADQTYRLNKMIEGRDDVYVLHSAQVAREARRRFSEVGSMAAFRPNFRAIYVRGEREDRFLQESQTIMATWAGSEFFSVFSGYTFLHGDQETALQRPNQVVLSEKTALRYFGSTDVVGRSLRIGESNIAISGVLAPLDGPSHLSFDLLRTLPIEEMMSTSNSILYTYLKLVPGATPDNIVESMPTLYGSVRTEARDPSQLSYAAENLRDIHLGTQVARPITPPVDVQYLWAFGILGVIVLGISCINYMNLTTAMYADRSTEVGVRKSMGAKGGQVARQFLLETVLLTGLAAPVAFGSVVAIRPWFNEMMNTSIPQPLFSLWAWGSVVLLTLIVGFAAGLHPAMLLARKKTTELFEGSAFSRSRGWTIRHGLLVLQFTLLIGLVCGSVFVNRQLAYIQSTDLGFEEESILQISNGLSLYERDDEGNPINPRYKEFQARLLASPSVVGLSSMTRTPGEFWYTVSFSPAQDTSDVFQAVVLRTDHRIFDVLDIKGVDGEYFQRMPEERPSQAILVSENFQDEVRSPDDANPSRAYYNSAGTEVPIAGTFETINFFSLRDQSTPIVISARSEVITPQRIVIRLAPGSLAEGVRLVKESWNQVLPNEPIQYSFLKDQIAQMYEQEQQFGRLSVILSGIALLLAVFGLIAVASYMTRLRVKEIGIRKSLGASVSSILLLLNREFVILVGVAFLIASPIAWWVIENWLNGFAYRTNVSFLGLIGIGFGALLLTVIAVTLQTWQAAQTDPVDVLRNN